MYQNLLKIQHFFLMKLLSLAAIADFMQSQCAIYVTQYLQMQRYTIFINNNLEK